MTRPSEVEGRGRGVDAARRQHHLVVHLVAQQPQVVAGAELHQVPHEAGRVHRAGGVGRRVDEQHLGAGRHQRVERGDIGQEVLVGRQQVEHRPPAEQAHHLVHVGKTGRGQQHLVAGLEQGQIHRIESVHGAGGDHDLLRRRLDAVHPAQLLAEELPQAGQAAVGAVSGVAGAGRPGRSLDHVRRRGEAGLAHLEADHAVSGSGGRVEEDPYLRAAQPGGSTARSPHGPANEVGTANGVGPAERVGPANGVGPANSGIVTGSGPRLWTPGRGAGRDRSSAAPSPPPARSTGGRRGARAAPGSAPSPTTS